MSFFAVQRTSFNFPTLAASFRSEPARARVSTSFHRNSSQAASARVSRSYSERQYASPVVGNSGE